MCFVVVGEAIKEVKAMTASFYARIFSKTRKMKVFSAVVVDEMIGDHFVNGLLCEFYKMILQKEFLEVYYLKLLINLPADIGE